ncbi:hypothetical protein IAR50_006447 [Cryptococcus sp. DSM 104548]
MTQELIPHQSGLHRGIAATGPPSESAVLIAPMTTWHPGASSSLTPPHIGIAPSTPLPPPNNLPPRVLTERESQLVKHLSRLQFFLATAPTRWMGSEYSGTDQRQSLVDASLSSPHPNLNKFLLPNGEYVACVFWNGLYHITGTDIVRALVFRFEAFSRPEGVFSDLRNLKPGTDACLEEPKSSFLDLLFRNGCIRTQKKVFYWFSVPHDRLFLDALERDLKREKMGLEPTTVVVGEPARSFRYDPKRSLFEQFAGKQPGLEETIDTGHKIIAEPSMHDYQPLNLEVTPSRHRVHAGGSGRSSPAPSSPREGCDHNISVLSANLHRPCAVTGSDVRENLACPTTANNVLFSRSLLKGSPAYKQGRKRVSREKKRRLSIDGASTSGNETAEDESGSETEHFHRQPTETAGTSFPLLRPSSNSTPSGMLDEQASSVGPFESPVAPQFLPLLSLSRVKAMNSAVAGDNILQAASHPSWSSTMEGGSGSVYTVSHDGVNMLPTHSLDGDGDKFQSFDSLGLGSRLPSPSILRGFSCPLLSCGRLFKRLEHLKRHVRTHTQERPYECARCSKRFSRSDNLTQHYKTHERQERGERDRSERLKTEVSEAVDEDMSAYLEAQVDAQAEAFAKHNAEYLGIGHGTTAPINSMSGNSDVSSFTRPDVATIPSSQNAHKFSHQVLTTWQSGPTIERAGDHASMTGLAGAGRNRCTTKKRPRSMTPNLSSARGMSILARGLHSMSSRPDYLFHPYAPASSFPTMVQGSTRATSVDPHIFQSRLHDPREQNPTDSLRSFCNDVPASSSGRRALSGDSTGESSRVQPGAISPSAHGDIVAGIDHAAMTQPPSFR